MSTASRIKRILLNQAVEENLGTIRGELPRSRYLVGRPGTPWLRVLLVIVVPAAVFALSYSLSTLAEGKMHESVRLPAGGTLDGSPAVHASLGSPPTSDRIYTTPQPLDPAVLPLSLRRVVLDPGHGGSNLGTVAPGGLPEKDITLDIARRLGRLLERHGYEVVMTRQVDESRSLKERADLANAAEGDIFISIHVNWMEYQEIRGVETFYLGSTDDPYVTALAAKENQDSGYSLADFRDILERVYADVRQSESRQLAGALQEALYDSLSQVNPEVRNRGVKSAPFGVLVRTEMPAILAEVSCLSNELEARLLGMPSYRQLLAEALLNGVEGFARELSQEHHIGSL